MTRAHPHVHDIIKPRAMGHRRRIKGRILRTYMINICKIPQCHLADHPMGDHHALGPSCGARGVKQPRQIVAVSINNVKGAPILEIT